MDYHVMEQTLDQKTIMVCLHFDVPGAAQNAINKSYRDIIPYMERNGPEGMTVRDRDTGVLASKLPYISDSNFNNDHATEAQQVANGEVIEVIRSHRFSSLGLTNAQKKAEIDALWNDVKAEVEAELDIGIQYYGYSANAT